MQLLLLAGTTAEHAGAVDVLATGAAAAAASRAQAAATATGTVVGRCGGGFSGQQFHLRCNGQAGHCDAARVS